MTTTLRPLRFAATAVLLLYTLAGCGGGGIAFPEGQPVAASPEAKRKAIAAQATELTAPLRQAINDALAQGRKLTDVHNDLVAQPLPASSGGEITAVRVEYGGAIVADVSVPASSGTSVNGQLIWVAYSPGDGLVRWYCFASYASANEDTGGACFYPGDGARGRTWTARIFSNDAVNKLSLFGCIEVFGPHSCFFGIGPGATSPVLQKLPLLCVNPAGVNRPEVSALEGLDFVGNADITPEVYGVQLLGHAPGDALCRQRFGDGWTMANTRVLFPYFADFGEAFGFMKTPLDGRFWVRDDWSNSNPWCATLTGLPCDR